MPHEAKDRFPVWGSGLGLRREMLATVLAASDDELAFDFLEVAPENWINMGGRYGRQFSELTARFPFVAHGLSLSIGGPAPLDEAFVRDVKNFLKQHNVACYSEHLSYCGDDGHLYDLMPLPFTDEAVSYVAQRIRRVQDILEQRLAIENVSYYAALDNSLSEIEFINAVLEEADCDLLLDVNNVYVNAINHRYDPKSFIDSIPSERIAYVHIAGHFDEADDLKVDTHGDSVKEDVWDLLRYTYDLYGSLPTLLERDFNIPAMTELNAEVERIKQIQEQVSKQVVSQHV